MRFKIDIPSPTLWKTIVPEGSEPLTDMVMLGGKLLVSSVLDGVMKTRLFTTEGKELGQILTPPLEFPQRVHHACALK